MIFKKYNLFLLATLFCNYNFCPESATQTTYEDLLKASQPHASLDRTHPAYYKHESGVILLRKNSQKYKDDSWYYFSRAGILAILASAGKALAETLKEQKCPRLSGTVNFISFSIGIPALCVACFYAPYLWWQGRKNEKQEQNLKVLYAQEAREQLEQKASA